MLLWAAAMVGGCLFKRFIQGAKGMEQIPLLVWYREFGNLEAVSVSVSVRSEIVNVKCKSLIMCKDSKF